MNYYIKTFGCQMNHSDSERIAAVLENIGYQKTSKMDDADLILINMCSVRQSAVDRVYGLQPKFEKLKTKLPTTDLPLQTILTGCILKSDKVKFKKMFDLVLDIKDLPNWPQKLATHISTSKIKDNFSLKDDYLEIKPKYENSFSAFVPISNGCNNFCSYCVVPYARGREICRDHRKILEEINKVIQRGFKEIWLLGQNVNSYQSPANPNLNFPKLLRTVNDIPGNFWLRFTSPHPKDLSDELINTMAESKKVTEYLNLPVQSGDNEILKKMRRPYTIKHYKNLVKKIRGKIPNIALSTDVIVGFPGETKKQFENTVKLFKEIKFDMAYIAKYSPRNGTQAAKLEDNISEKEKQEREKILTDILKQTAQEKNKRYIGKEVEVLVNEQKNGFLLGKTRTYKTLKFKSDKNLVGDFVKVKIIDATPWGLKGKILT